MKRAADRPKDRLHLMEIAALIRLRDETGEDTATRNEERVTDFPIDSIRFDENGLVPAIVQDVNTRGVLMLGFMNRDALLRTVREGKVCFWSRSRQKFWLKGETSGMFLQTRASG
jgi:phosphoribosyl-AMP cyclohydrolase